MSESDKGLPFALSLTASRATEISLVGGKGANLARLKQAEFPVPEGFVVTTAAYSALLTESDIPDRIRALESLDPQDTEATAEAGGALRDAIQSLSLPSEVQTAIKDSVADTGVDKAYAARSSATAEDLPSASFAGQHETLLNVQGEEEVAEAVRTCMASLFTDRAITYRARNDIPHDQVSLAVVVQEMTHPDASGILFTADPTTGERSVAVIDAGFGLGEAQVGGAVTGDHVRIDKATGDILSYDIGDKRVAVQSIPGGGTETIELSAEQRSSRVLSDDQIRALASIAEDVEELFGTPQDIEWALVDGEIVLLQSRPITTLPEQAVASSSDWTVPDSNLAYARVGPAELLPDPLSPLFESLGGPIMTESSVEMAREFLGTDAFSRGTYAFTTVNGYAYYSVSLAPKFLLRILGRGLWRYQKSSVMSGHTGEKQFGPSTFRPWKYGRRRM
ncbi:PEP/pyruvate-binding domain-containing protein [Natrinema caseinilyticum]|uniref:PEP/pyruvate-binding domain-containing protein n=1 Tax=Natrinema caseinilyticum TaxID=2961570 RepID=UPI0020C1BC9F|nr:PEP/pyruvate-binding domain-containing protein [Natrinema caseinilyticum]